MIRNLQYHVRQIRQFNKDRIVWLRLSIFVVIVITLLSAWALVSDRNLPWILVLSGMTLAAIWWYWTMKLVKELLMHRLREIDILSSLIEDIKDIKKDIKKLDKGS